MKPGIPEKATVILLDGENATVRLQAEKTCRGCGMAEMGLCRAGGEEAFLTVGNPCGARVGDTVIVGIARAVQAQGYLLGYLLPAAFLFLGAGVGRAIGARSAMPWLDVVLGFLCLAVAGFSSFRRLRELDRAHRLVVRKVLSDETSMMELHSDEERRYEGCS